MSNLDILYFLCLLVIIPANASMIKLALFGSGMELKLTSVTVKKFVSVLTYTKGRLPV